MSSISGGLALYRSRQASSPGHYVIGAGAVITDGVPARPIRVLTLRSGAASRAIGRTSGQPDRVIYGHKQEGTS